MHGGMRSRNALTIEEIEEIFSKMQVYEFNGNRIRTMAHAGQRWIVFADICKALGYKNPNHESKKVQDTEKCKIEIGLKNSLAVCINKRGLYSFSVFSNKLDAVVFRDWAFETIFAAEKR